MSSFTKRTVQPVAGSAEVDFFVNLYKAADGSIEPGARTYRTEANALRKAQGVTARGLRFVKVIKMTAKLP